MKMKVNEQGRAIFETEGINQTWTSSFKSIKVNSASVMHYYPSRIDLDFASDSNDRFYLVKNKGWSAYLDPTILSSNFSDKELVDKNLLLSGTVPKVEEYNELVLSYILENIDERLINPDYLDSTNYEYGIVLLLDAINNVLKEEKTEESDYKLECLGSLYMLYKAKYKFIK